MQPALPALPALPTPTLFQPFQGLQAADLEPLHYVQRTVRGRSVHDAVRVEDEHFPRPARSILFDAGTLLTIGGLKIRRVGIVVSGGKRATKVLLLEDSSGPVNGVALCEIPSCYAWIDPAQRYSPSSEQWDAYENELREIKLRQREARRKK